MAHNVQSDALVARIEPDDGSNVDNDSAFDGSSVESTSYQTSLSSSVKNYKYENGRRYHAFHEGEYVIPNDEDEQDRMDLGHHIYQMLLAGNLQLAPIPKDPHRVLDLGTGTGIWAIDFADQYPSAQVIGMDLSPIQPTWVPPNCVFEVDDYESNWPYTNKFDFIHGRELLGSIANYDRLFTQALQHLNSGGYFEMQTTTLQPYSDDGTLEKAPSCQEMVRNLCLASDKFGKSMATDTVNSWEKLMSKVGFVDVTSKIYKLPLSPWPKDAKLKELGRYQQVQQLKAVNSYSLALFTRVLGWSREELEVLLTGVRKELKDRSIHIYLKTHVVYGQKP